MLDLSLLIGVYIEYTYIVQNISHKGLVLGGYLHDGKSLMLLIAQEEDDDRTKLHVINVADYVIRPAVREEDDGTV